MILVPRHLIPSHFLSLSGPGTVCSSSSFSQLRARSWSFPRYRSRSKFFHMSCYYSKTAKKIFCKREGFQLAPEHRYFGLEL